MRKLFVLLFIFSIGLCFAQSISALPKPGVHIGLKEIQFQINKNISAYFTTDGNRPSQYSRKLPSTYALSKNTVFRVAYYDKDGSRRDTTFSYFVEREHTLPVISIVTDPDNFFDYSRGIYVKGCCADSLDPFFGANFWQNWEREINITFFETSGAIGFSQNAGVKIFGGYSVGRPQKSLAIIARSKYGKKKFEHQIFPNLEIDKFKSFILRNAGSDMQEVHIRDVFATQLVKNTGIDIQEYRAASVYINGEYWGIYNIREKINEHYIESHYGIDKDSLIIMRHRSGRQHGSVMPYRNMISYLSNNRLTDRSALTYISSQMDIDNFILYNICETYTANGDAGGNIRYFKGLQPETRWRWILYDLDIGMNISSSKQYLNNTVEDFTTMSSEKWPNPAWSTFIIRRILENDSLRNRYINQFCDLLNTNFKPTNANSVLDKLVSDVAPEISHHLERWNVSRNGYEKSLGELRLFINERPNVLFKHLQERFSLDSLIEIEVNTNSASGCVQLNTLTVSQEFKGNYFRNVPVFVKALPKFDYDFLGWKNRTETNDSLFLSLTESTKFEPIFQKRARSAYYGKLIISEVNAKQENGGDWIEIYNNSPNTIDLNDFFLKDKEQKHIFNLGEAREIEPFSFLVICEDERAFSKRYGEKIKTVGGLTFGFNSKDVVNVYDVKKQLVHRLKLTDYKEQNRDENIAISDLRSPTALYFIEKETPGKPSQYYLQLLKQEAEDAFYKSLFFYLGISAAALLIVLLLVYFKSKR